MKHISSVHNESIKKIVSLHNSKGRSIEGQFITEGLRSLKSFASASQMPSELYVTEALYTDAKIIFPASNPITVTEHVMHKISPSITPPGILGVFDQVYSTLSNIKPNYMGIVCSEISDPGNMGALIRSTAACGYKTIIVTGGTDPFSPKVVQASAGTIAHVNIIQCSWNELVLAQNRPQLCAMVVSGGSTITELPQQDMLLVVGNEAHGLSNTQRNQCEQTLSLPMDQSTESFNVSIAGSIALFLLKNKNLFR